MRARTWGLLAALAAMALLGAREARSQAMSSLQSQPTFQSEGRDRLWFLTSCSTSAWTVVVSSDAISRSTFILSVSSNIYQVCLGSATASGPCDSSHDGPELGPNTALTDYGRGEWYCRTSAGTLTQKLKGYRTRDRGDYGNIGAKGLQ